MNRRSVVFYLGVFGAIGALATANAADASARSFAMRARRVYSEMLVSSRAEASLRAALKLQGARTWIEFRE